MVKNIFLCMLLSLMISSSYAADILRDPTTPLNFFVSNTSQVQSSQTSMTLQAVFLGKKPRAVIGGISYKIGDECGDFVLAAIKRSSVILLNEKDGQKMELSLYSFRNEK